jgi:hypothetical protein
VDLQGQAWTAVWKFWKIHNSSYLYVSQNSANECIPELVHHTAVQCPVDGRYWCGSSPILVPLTPGPVKTSAPEVLFDIDGDGNAEMLGWPEDPDNVAFLAADFNGNGIIDNGKELLGNYTRYGLAATGFTALAQIAFNEDGEPKAGEVNATNKIFAKLLLWNDRNRNGLSEPSELQPASNYLLAVGTGYYNIGKKDTDGNKFRFKGWARFKNGVERPIYDVLLAVRPE